MKKLLVLFFLALSNVFLFINVSAQVQPFNYSGNSPESYQCFDEKGVIIKVPGTDTPMQPEGPDAQGNFYCTLNGERYLGYLKPPALQQIEVWFVRILYAIWALVASLSFLLIVKLGYDYMITRGDVTKITAIRQRIINYAIGFALVFLAVPVLTTVFRFLGINENVDCYNVNMPGFQFFYTSLCTDPRSTVVENPCNLANVQEAHGKICSVPGTVIDSEIDCGGGGGFSPGATPYCAVCQAPGTGNESTDNLWRVYTKTGQFC